MSATVGIVANPAAGKDIRRLVSAASPVSDMAKIGIIRRAAIGAAEGGATRLLVADDRHALARRAVRGLDALGIEIEVEVLDLPILSTGGDSRRAAATMSERGVGAVIVLGGDGTHRDVTKGWRRVPMVALSTGTNNVFPRALEATTAGHAAGLVAAGTVALDEVADDAAVIDVELQMADGSLGTDLGLVDVALTSAAFTGSRAVWEVASLREIVTAIAEPDSVGLSAIAAAVAPSPRGERGGVHVRVAPPVDPKPGRTPPTATATTTATPTTTRVRCAIAPGSYVDVDIEGHRRLRPGDEVLLSGPGVLTFDGERDVVLGPDDKATAQIGGGGPRVIDVARAMTKRVEMDLYRAKPCGEE